MTKIGDHINIVISPPLKARWPQYISSLSHFRTVAFERAFMLSMISFGWVDGKWTLVLSSWMHIVPECYRMRVGEIVVAVFEKDYKGDKYDAHETLPRFVEDARNAIWNELEPVMPGGL